MYVVFDLRGRSDDGRKLDKLVLIGWCAGAAPPWPWPPLGRGARRPCCVVRVCDGAARRVPDAAPIKAKMTYASSEGSLKGKLDLADKIVKCTDASDLDHADLMNKLKRNTF